MIDAKICLEIPTVHSKLIPKVLSHVKRKEKVIIMERKYNTPYVMCIASIGSQESRAFQRQAAIIMVNTIPAAITALKNLLGSPDFKDKPSLTFNILLLNRDEIGICIPPSLIESPHYSLFSSSFPPHITSRINIIPFFSLDSEWNIAKYILSFFTSSQLATSFRQEKMEMSRRISESQADCECITPLKSSLTSINSKISAPSLDESSSKDYQLSFLAALPYISFSSANNIIRVFGSVQSLIAVLGRCKKRYPEKISAKSLFSRKVVKRCKEKEIPIAIDVIESIFDSFC
eukprot:gnl/Carplike_NY0171/6934_a9562_183.p1 GENE.gnl/Carplike_NY0171/6934_a9562_183~~gnl/Carplike_NY0171/6934_a9562_183.p1  ORF type:complete len:301 (+),score=17.45 gnl/Carplike_NY0171/6934_a9562_183:35-904(+)